MTCKTWLESEKDLVVYANTCNEGDLGSAIDELFSRWLFDKRSKSYTDLCERLIDIAIATYEKRFGEWLPF